MSGADQIEISLARLEKGGALPTVTNRRAARNPVRRDCVAPGMSHADAGCLERLG